jgi:hypothetical protein
MSFQKATKKQAKLRLALIGPSGSGKTYTALTLATHLVPGGRIAVIDTERGSASKYADLFTFDVQEPESFHPRTYIEAIAEAQAAGYDVLVIDSLSHAWMGRDGALELVDKAAKRNPSGNSFAAWRDVTPLHNALVDALLATKLHIIVTMRSKMEYVQEKDERGKTVIRKVGLQPIQRDGLEYEFDVVGDMDVDNTLVVTKTRCSVLAGAVISKPGKPLADTLAHWLDGAPALATMAAQSGFDPAGSPAPEVMHLTPQLAAVTVATTHTNGNGSSGHAGSGSRAIIRTPKWGSAAKALAEQYSCYRRSDGQPDTCRMAALAAQCGFPEITEETLPAVVAALTQKAAEDK